MDQSDKTELLRSSNNLYKSGRFKEALEHLTDKEEFYKEVSAYYVLKGLVLSAMNEHNLAVTTLLEAIKIDPLDPMPYANIGDCLAKNLQFEEAEKYFQLALTVEDDFFEAIVGLGVVAFQKHDYLSCEQYFLKALRLKPDHNIVLTNLGNCYSVQGRYDEALTLLNKSIARDKGNSLARTNRGLIKLGRNQFDSAWEDYEFRWDSGNFMAKRFEDIPRWTGPGSSNQNVLIWAEQGIGDEIMFASIFNELAGLSERFFIECDPRLYKLFENSFSNLEFIPKGLIKNTAPIHSQIPLASLGGIFRNSRKKFPKSRQRFLIPTKSELNPETQALLQSLPRPWIGVSWESYALTQNFRGRKSIKAGEFSLLTKKIRGSLINLQFSNPHKHEKQSVQEVPDSVVSLPNLNLKNDIESLVSLIADLDEVITIGNSVAHLCGATGVNTTVLLPSVPDWRWGHTGDTSIWYPSLKLLRNSNPDSWSDFLQELGKNYE